MHPTPACASSYTCLRFYIPSRDRRLQLLYLPPLLTLAVDYRLISHEAELRFLPLPVFAVVLVPTTASPTGNPYLLDAELDREQPGPRRESVPHVQRAELSLEVRAWGNNKSHR